MRTSDAYWRQPLKWDREAEKYKYACDMCGARYADPDALGRPWRCAEYGCNGFLGIQRPRVFCDSLCDIFEDRPELVQWRVDLQELINATPNLDWLLLTKRLDNFSSLWPCNESSADALVSRVWLGVSIENQAAADKWIIDLLKLKARHCVAKVFISVEPMLGPVDISPWLPPFDDCDHYDIGCTRPENVFANTGNPKERPGLLSCRPEYCVFGRSSLDWVICGGESGPNARPMHPDWARSLRDQCVAAGVPFFFKQLGEWKHCDQFTNQEIWDSFEKKTASIERCRWK